MGERAGPGEPSDRAESREPIRLGPLETLGAWLRVWTPPKGAAVPPVPWARVGALAALAAVVIGGALLAIVPAIEGGKRDRAARERREDSRQRAATARRLAEEGRPRGASIPRPPNLATPSPGREREARRGLVDALEADVARDARARVRDGKLKGPILAVRCRIEPPSQRYIERDLTRRASRYKCLVITRRGRGGRFLVGHPFRARIDYRRFLYRWRKVCLPPGEGAARLAC